MEPTPTSSSVETAANVAQTGLLSAHTGGTIGNEAVVPQPSEALMGLMPPPFLTKTYDMIDDPHTDDIVSWSTGNNSFIVWNPPELASSILPNYFKHNNFSSFVRQLNTYGFRKVDPDRWEFAAEGFIRGQKHLLKTLRRRKPVTQSQTQQQIEGESSQGPLELARYENLGEDIKQLKHDRNVLMHELVQMRQQQQTTDQTMQYLGQRLAATEQRQRQMMTFLAKTMQNPSIFANLFQGSVPNKRIGAQRRKRHLSKPEQLTHRGDSEASSSEGRTPRNEIALINPTKASFAEILNSAELSPIDTTSDLFEELFRGLEWGNYGQGDENSPSDSDPNLNLGSDKNSQLSEKREVFVLQNSSSSKSSSTEEMAGKAEKESFEGPEYPPNEQHISASSISYILDSNLEEDWNELFESMDVYDKSNTCPEEEDHSSKNALVEHQTTAGQGLQEIL